MSEVDQPFHDPTTATVWPHSVLSHNTLKRMIVVVVIADVVAMMMDVFVDDADDAWLG